MSSQAATTAIVISALVIGGVYAYRWLAGGKGVAKSKLTAAKLVGLGPQVTPEGFLVAWGVIFLSLSLGAQLSPRLAGAFAILLTVSSLIANFLTVSESVGGLIASKNAAVSTGGPEESLPESSSAGLSNLAGQAEGALSAAGNLVSGVAPAVLARNAVKKAGLGREFEREVLTLNRDLGQYNAHLGQSEVNELATGKRTVAQIRAKLDEFIRGQQRETHERYALTKSR